METEKPSVERKDASQFPKAPMERKPDDYYWDENKEPHALRRQVILKAHPEIKQLFGPCPRTKYIVLGTAIFQFIMASYMPQLSWFWVFVLAYVVSGTLNHMMMMANHEISHNLAFKSPFWNRILGIISTIPIGLPVSNTFRRYHLEHHKYQGEHDIDVDVPSRIEAWLFKSVPGKFIWVILQPFFYGLRPLVMKPKSPGFWEAVNFVIVFGYDILMFQFFGVKAVFYHIVGSVLGCGLHPVAGHFISEHYVFNPGFETYSYYGPLNIFTFNVGYHNEHHDFANIPGSRLPQVRKMAPEFYNDLPTTPSYVMTILEFIFSPTLNFYDRVKRETMSSDARQILFDREHKTHGSWRVW